MPVQLSSPLILPTSTSAQTATEIPRFVYGTAWKKEQTARLVALALRAGFRGVDTAAQPKHYREDLVGDGVREVLAEGAIKRADLYVGPIFNLTPLTVVAVMFLGFGRDKEKVVAPSYESHSSDDHDV